MRKARIAAPPTEELSATVTHQYFYFKFISKIYNGTSCASSDLAAVGVNSVVELTQQPVRTASIRGQLRYWWRAIASVLMKKANQNTTLSDLREKEKHVWGLAGSASKVSTTVYSKGGTTHGIGYNPLHESYALFPLQTKNNQDVRLHMVREISDTWTLQCLFASDLDDEDRSLVCDAVRAWMMFGGYGSRTRRGLGAVAQVNENGFYIMITPQAVHEFLEKYGTDDESNAIVGIPYMTTKWNSRQVNTLDSAYKFGFQRMRDFRQTIDKKIDTGRNPGNGVRPGRSRWPEPDAIRRRMRNYNGAHRPIHPIQGKFPRGVFGLPITFKFSGNGEPISTILQPQGFERMASPIILKPIVLNGGQFCSSILVMKEKRDTPLCMELRPENNQVGDPNVEGVVQHMLTSGDIQAVNRQAPNMRLPNAFREANTSDPIEAFYYFYAHYTPA